MSKQVILNQASLAFFGEFGLPDKITSDLGERLSWPHRIIDETDVIHEVRRTG